jgi:fumarate reductase subunit C
MSHQPFETWILELETLPMTERRSLQSHLDTCPQCQRTLRKWQGAQRELRARKQITPAPGFTARWQAGLAERRLREQRRQAWRVFTGFVVAAIFFLLILVGYVMVSSTPSDWLAAFIRSASTSLNFFNLVTYLARTWFSNTPLVVNIALWVSLSIALCLLSLIWAFTLWRTSKIGVSTNEQ